jgi:lipoprotein-anchoring transpeptidase ErfK/SrfK
VQLDLAAFDAAPVELTGHLSALTRMEKIFAIALLVANFAVFSRAQNPSPAPSPSAAAAPPQNQGPVVAASPAPTPAPVLETKLVVSILEQKLAVVVNDKVYRTYKISTSRYGEGDALGSWCTPTGRLAVATKIGATAPVGGVFQGRRYTGEVLSVNAPGRDPIVSRIIWLRGLDYANKNAFHRCIYIHGTPQEDTLGTKASYGCIRMRSSDVVEVFNWITVGTEVAISDKPISRAVKELADDKRLMATNTTKTELKSELVR